MTVTVGADDSSLFGYLLGDLRGLPAADRLRLAVAHGSAAVALTTGAASRTSQHIENTGS